jgi:hypothetical protein
MVNCLGFFSFRRWLAKENGPVGPDEEQDAGDRCKELAKLESAFNTHSPNNYAKSDSRESDDDSLFATHAPSLSDCVSGVALV